MIWSFSENNNNLGISTGILLAVPAPMGREVDFDEIHAAVKQALDEAELNGMNLGRQDVTPWLLQRVQEITGGRSVQRSMHSDYILIGFTQTASRY